jgi:cytochrome c biogenesis protein CcdA/thiol-disulfide isomerase/thioredoxin
MFLFFGAFIAGLLTVVAPCVLPLLPIIIGGSVTGDVKDKKRPIIIAVSLAISLIIFTLLLKVSSLLVNIPPNAITYFSGSVIILLGILTLFPLFYARITAAIGIEARAQRALGKGFKTKGLAGPIITGAALGPVFSSCSPVYAYILATVLPANFGQAFAYIISYVLGLSLVLLLIGYYGQRFVGKIKFASDPKGWFQRAIAIIFIIVGLLVFTGYDKKFQTYVSQHTPFNLDQISSSFLPKTKNSVDNSKLFNVTPYDAPKFVGINDWINSKPLTTDSLKGKVVLVDFWTYSCINCIRNNPYLEKWYETYKDKGLVVVGIHAPEFSFEKVLANVQNGVKDQHLTYPVGLDNNLDTWNNYENRSWPASYLIDKTGKVRRIHEGEGEYNQEEDAIRALLAEDGTKLPENTTSGKEAVPITSMQSPETYLGSARASNYEGTPALGSAPTQSFKHPANLNVNGWSLGGTWEVQGEKIIARGNSSLKFRISGKEAYLVGGSAVPANVGVKLNDQPISGTAAAGPDITDSHATFAESRLYRLVSYPKLKSGDVLELTVPDGVEFNAFTFGS